MAVVAISNPVPGVYQAAPSAGAPGAGTDEVQTLTIGGTPTGGTFRIRFDGWETGDIAWSSTNNTLRDNVDAALEALPNIPASGVTTAVGTMTAGVGTLTITFAGGLGKRNVPLAVVSNNSMTGTSPTAAITVTTPGVNAHGLGSPKGAQATDVTNGKLYINTGTPDAPTWTVVGSQS